MTPSIATESVPGWRITGLFWDEHRAQLVASRPEHADRSLTLRSGQDVALALAEPRVCVGLWDAERGRRLCERPLAAGRGAQCPSCSELDLGKRLARDAYVDDRDYLLYLAWFAPGLVKVGMTAAERGRCRLLEQGALSSTVIAQGPLAPVREAERAIRRSGLAVEQVPLQRKLAALEQGRNADPSQAQTDLARVREGIAEQGLLSLVQALTEDVQDHMAAYGLVNAGALSRYHLLAPASALGGAHLVGGVRAVWGRVLILTVPDLGEPLVVDTRLVSGYRLGPAPSAPRGLPTHLHTTNREDTDDPHQIGLF